MTSASDLNEALLRSGLDDQSVAAASAHLLRLSAAHDVVESTIRTEDLLRIYRRRLKHRPPGVVGLESLVAGLEAVVDDRVEMAVLEDEGEVVLVVRTMRGVVIGCVVGPDRRL